MVFLSRYFLWLILYSVIGWIYESIVVSIQEKRLINRGFLYGPLCPIYGVTSVIAILALDGRIESLVALFFSGMIFACGLEYVTSVVFEKLFHARWWDYSSHRFNFQGRICLLAAVVFGSLTVVLIKYLHPFVKSLMAMLSDRAIVTLAAAFFVALSVDIILTVWNLLKLNGRLAGIQTAINRFASEYSRRAGNIKNTIINKFEESEYYSERIKKLMSLKRLQTVRLARAFPKLRSLKYNDAWQRLRNFIGGFDDD